MARKNHVMSAGNSALSANAIVGEVAAGLTGAGTTQADALLVSFDANEFTTVASGTGARLTALSEVGDTLDVYNFGANALLVYPPAGQSINALAANAGFSLAANGKASFRKLTATRWGANASA